MLGDIYVGSPVGWLCPVFLKMDEKWGPNFGSKFLRFFFGGEVFGWWMGEEKMMFTFEFLNPGFGGQ